MQVGEQRSIPWFKPDGTRQIWRHPVNARKVGTRVTKYAARIRDTGIVAGVRGEPWLVHDPNKDQYLCISYGTLLPDQIGYLFDMFYVPRSNKTMSTLVHEFMSPCFEESYIVHWT